jgi:hypothetical protein
MKPDTREEPLLKQAGEYADAAENMHGMTWEEWREAFETEHEKRRASVDGFEGYGPRSVMDETGEDSWRGYWRDGYTPEGALDEDITYWDA